MNPNEPSEPHPFVLCTLEHLFEREPHCSVCDGAASHPLHDPLAELQEGWPA